MSNLTASEEKRRKRSNRTIDVDNHWRSNKTQALGAAASNVEYASHQKKPKLGDQGKPQVKQLYGNYRGYYRSRRGEHQGTLDPRLTGLGDERLRDLFRNKRVLDIGCNEGKVSLDIAITQHPSYILGVDLDDILVHKAWTRLQGLYSTMNPKGDVPTLSQFQYFPQSMTYLHGFLTMDVPPNHPTTNFPFYIDFQAVDICDHDFGDEKFDAILALSVTKWIHLHQGDDGLKSVFKKVYDTLNEDGVFILEPQPYSSYLKRAKTDKKMKKVYDQINFRDDQFARYLIDELKFKRYETIKPDAPTKGFSRELLIFYK
ncbi:Bicoid-interacting protein 3-domain-containing protein [Syncephalastrum racemosum]|uniref:RNA methyltransferase n=1 Tax=Syncephalastrum racemosum TaxID=13706 RepID=A0A1X2HUV5_SYNRA|nr:Bicoid-interacting protein 3-domain-containing protein [Syncephalastrum racemosum]